MLSQIRIPLTVISLLYSLFIQAQQKEKSLKKISCDCKNAIKLTINKRFSYGPTVDTSGFGLVQEIPRKQKSSKYYFETEHNTSWYLLDLKYTGLFTFTIEPKDSTNDIDFLLFKDTDSTFCNEFPRLIYKPLRSNISRNSMQGLTGLNYEATEEFVKEGKGNNFSKALEVKANEKLVLILDNISKHPKGYTLHFAYIKNVEIKGNIEDEDKKPIEAEVVLTDKAGKEVARTLSSAKTGEYRLNKVIREGEIYALSIYNDSTFFKVLPINAAKSKTYKDIRTELPRLRAGLKYKVDNLLFVGGKDDLIPASLPSVKNLARLLKKNKKIRISIEGHINNSPGLIPKITKEEAQKLSEKRALRVYNNLVSEGIDKDRMETIGYGDKMMIYPLATTEAEMEQNRRVEIKIISLE